MRTSADDQEPRVSVVIGFKDWGLKRLEQCIRSVHASLGMIEHEIVIADYGSKDIEAIAQLARWVDARHEIVPTQGEWSRSRALNAGVSAARGDILLATDADMIFSPGALERVVAQLEKHPQEIVILQCRDLPVGVSHDDVADQGFQWGKYAEIAKIRPRWGMGGLVGIWRGIWERLRGWDERFHTYGGEDIDFAKRAQKYGARIDWLDAPGVTMYHMWHPLTSVSAARSAEAAAAIETNRRIHESDPTFARNRVQPRYLPENIVPLVTVLVDSGDANREELSRTIASVLSQSVTSLEICVRDNHERNYGDSRVRQVVDGEITARGTFTTAAVAGDVWAEDRLEKLLDLWAPGVGLLSDRSGILVVDDERVPVVPLYPLTTESPGSRQTLVRTSLIPSCIEILPSNWPVIVRFVGSTGADWLSASEVRHVTTVTLDTEEELHAERAAEARATKLLLDICGLQSPQQGEATLVELGRHANAILYGQEKTLQAVVPNLTDLSGMSIFCEYPGRWEKWTIESRSDERRGGKFVWRGSSLDFAERAEQELRAQGGVVQLLSEEESAYDTSRTHQPDDLARLAEELSELTRGESVWLVAHGDDETLEQAVNEVEHGGLMAEALHATVTRDGTRTAWLLVRYARDSSEEALSVAARLRWLVETFVVETNRTHSLRMGTE